MIARFSSSPTVNVRSTNIQCNNILHSNFLRTFSIDNHTNGTCHSQAEHNAMMKLRQARYPPFATHNFSSIFSNRPQQKRRWNAWQLGSHKYQHNTILNTATSTLLTHKKEKRNSNTRKLVPHTKTMHKHNTKSDKLRQPHYLLGQNKTHSTLSTVKSRRTRHARCCSP